ncbi:MAG: M23 family metallopeptidase [Peptococcaceae bacterium]|jgi:biotin carboxyl carrier protein|nr:M23 family metallopeptidase [Peptococcaceae bacterium]
MTIKKPRLLLIALAVLLLFPFFSGCAGKNRKIEPQPPAGQEEVQEKAAAAPPMLLVSSYSVYPGDYLVLYLENGKETDEITARTGLGKYTPSFAPYRFGLVAFLPVHYTTKPGEYNLCVKIIRSGETVLDKQESITVKPKEFPSQYLKVSAGLEAKRDPGLWEKDAVHIGRARSASAKQPLWDSNFIMPVEGKITTEFGLIRYINNVESGRHSGLDIAAGRGTPVKAANSGTINLARKLNVTGNTVIIDHGLKLYSTYCHMDKILVKEGEEVKKGQVIGQVGSTGFSTGPHLHWNISIGSTFVNPWLFLDKDPLT